MAVFMLNICKFNDCGIIFPSLADLILHIEETHIDYDPEIIEQKEQQQPQSLPLSYVLKFYSNTARRDTHVIDVKKRLIQHANRATIRNGNIELNEHDADGSLGSEDSNSSMSWAALDEFSSDSLLKYGGQLKSILISDKPFPCPVPGCKKRYKNINGMRYHAKNGHKSDTKIRKNYKCHCGKSYKTSQGLRNHTKRHLPHPSSDKAANENPKQKNVEQPAPIVSAPKKLLAAKIQQNQRAVQEMDLGLLTPATSPDSSSSFGNLSPDTFINPLELQVNSAYCDRI